MYGTSTIVKFALWYVQYTVLHFCAVCIVSERVHPYFNQMLCRIVCENAFVSSIRRTNPLLATQRFFGLCSVLYSNTVLYYTVQRRYEYPEVILYSKLVRYV